MFAGCHPYLGDGYPDSWLMILDQLEKMNAEVLIPGHGHVGAPEDLALMRKYIVSLMNNVRLIHEQGGSADDAIDVSVPESFKDWILGRPFYSMNMSFLYNQFKAS